LGASVQITVPGTGRVVVSATVRVAISHTFGFDDEADVVVANNTTDCSVNAYTGIVWISGTAPSGGYLDTVDILRPFIVPALGTYTFYINGRMATGASLGDQFLASSLVAVFYPG